MKFSIMRRLVSEWLGTCFLVATVVGSGIMGQKLANGNEAIILLVNALATGAMLTLLILCFSKLSGAYFNPVVSMVLALNGKIDSREAALYVLVQVFGGVCGLIVAHLMFSESMVDFSSTVRYGPELWLAEIVATFGLVSIVLICLEFNPSMAPYCVGLFISAGYWFTSSTSFANPAVTIARTLTNTFTGIRPGDAVFFILAQVVGALLAFFIMRWLLCPQPECEQ